MLTIRPLQLVLAGLAALTLASAAQAQTIKSEHETGAVSGKITHIDTSANMFTIHEVTGADWTFEVNKETTFMSGDKRIPFSALKKGWTIVVNYDSSIGLKPTGNVALMGEVTDTP